VHDAIVLEVVAYTCQVKGAGVIAVVYKCPTQCPRVVFT